MPSAVGPELMGLNGADGRSSDGRWSICGIRGGPTIRDTTGFRSSLSVIVLIFQSPQFRLILFFFTKS